LLLGLDDIGTSLLHAEKIDSHEKANTKNAAMYEPVDVKNYSESR
jgi:hypothetical protein